LRRFTQYDSAYIVHENTKRLNKGLRLFIERNDASKIHPQHAERLRNMVSFLQSMANPLEVRSVPSWKAHVLTGNRKGTWSLWVDKNWRLTYRSDANEIEILDLNYEDYH